MAVPHSCQYRPSSLIHNKIPFEFYEVAEVCCTVYKFTACLTPPICPFLQSASSCDVAIWPLNDAPSLLTSPDLIESNLLLFTSVFPNSFDVSCKVLHLLFLWYSSCLSVWPSLFLLSIKTALLLLWLKNSTHFAHKLIKTKTFGCCSFSHADPSVWNSLPRQIRHIQSTTAFKTAMKTQLFKFYLY